MINRYIKTNRDECQTCGQDYEAALGYEDEIVSELRDIECCCGEHTYCQACVSDEATRCAHPGCRVVFCAGDGCAAGSNFDGELFCENHVPAPVVEAVEDPVTLFVVALERFTAASEGLRKIASGF